MKRQARRKGPFPFRSPRTQRFRTLIPELFRNFADKSPSMGTGDFRNSPPRNRNGRFLSVGHQRSTSIVRGRHDRPKASQLPQDEILALSFSV